MLWTDSLLKNAQLLKATFFQHKALNWRLKFNLFLGLNKSNIWKEIWSLMKQFCLRCFMFRHEIMERLFQSFFSGKFWLWSDVLSSPKVPAPSVRRSFWTNCGVSSPTPSCPTKSSKSKIRSQSSRKRREIFNSSWSNSKNLPVN